MALPAFLLVLCAFPARATNLPVGGGLLDSGLVGSYFNNNSLSGAPAFTRRDIRVDFDWGTTYKPGGSLSWTRLGQIGADNYSIRWEGRIMARFSETYTLKAIADSVRVWIKPGSQAEFGAPLIDYWPESEPGNYAAQTASFGFVAGEAYDIRIDYRERTGPAMMRLLWSSPSTPEEVIQPTAFVGEIPPGRAVVFADAVQGATNWGESNPAGLTDGVLSRDAEGWPTEDFNFMIRPGNADLNPGTYLVTFKGQARVSFHLVSGAVMRSADGSVTYGSSTNGTQGYDPATNTTTIRVFVPSGNGNVWPTFRFTDRDGPGSAFGVHSGITDLSISKPVTVGGDDFHDADELFDRKAVAALETFVTFRWNDVNGADDAGTSSGVWEHRRRWGPNVAGIRFDGENHEYKILLSNHTGRDLYIQVPHVATDDYVTKLAQLIRYGADADGNPYTTDQADPFFPPLNPNLRVIVEYSNETPWNTAGQYPQGNYMQSMPGVLRAAWLADPSSPDGRRFAAINFDGSMSTNPSVSINGMANGSRYFALRTVEISDIFRSVFGDEAMPAPGKHDPRIRPVLMYQYDNQNGTATNALNFIDRYFFKTDPASTFEGTPRPVSWYLYGGGAATYYASADRYGLEEMHPLTAGGLGTFEEPELAPGEARVNPPGSAWTFTGTAGIYRQAARYAGVVGSVPAPSNGVDAFNYRGMKITVGPQDVAIYEIGRHVHPGNSASQTIAIYEADGSNATRLSFTWSPSGFPAGQVAWRRAGQNVFIISNKAYSWPVILGAGRSYYIVALESPTGNSHSQDVPITPPPGISIDGTASGRLLNGVWTWQVGDTPNRTHGPLNIKVAPAPHVTDTGLNLGYLNDSKDGMESITSFAERFFSPQAAFIAGNGSMEIEVAFPAPGTYGLIYHLSYKRDQTPWDGVEDKFENRMMVHLLDGGDVINITPSGQTDTRPRSSGWNHETYWAKPHQGFDFYGSAPFEITDASKTYKIRFSGTNTSLSRVIAIDNVHIASAAKMTQGQIPSGGGFAEGAPDVSNWEARVMSMYKYPQSFGLKAISYEGGWYPGGDANKMPLQFASSFFAGPMLQGELNAMRALARAGLAVNTDYTLEFAMPDHGISSPDSYKRIQAWEQMNAGLAPEATNGQPLTSIMTSANAWLSRNTSGALMSDGGWFSWNVVAPESGYYDFRLETTGSGTVSARVDDAIVAVSGAPGVRQSDVPVFITKGLHTVRVLTQGGSASLVSLVATKPGHPPGFNGVTASPGNAEAFVRWDAQPGAAGYHVYFKSRLETAFTRFTVAPVTDTQLFVTGLQNNTTYNIVVTWINGSGVESAYSNQVSVVPSENPPLLAWEFDNSTNKTSGNLPANLQSGAVAGVVSLVSGPARPISTNTSVNNDGIGWGAGGFPASLNTDLYFGFSVTPAPGRTLRLTQLNLGLWVAGGSGSGQTGILNAELRVSTDNFSTHTVVPLSPAPSTVPTANMNANTGRLVTADLSGIPALQNLPDGTTASFRVYFWGTAVSYTGLGKLGNTTDDIVLYGFPVDSDAAEIPTASLPDGIYPAPLSVSLASATPGASMRYTTDGTNPTDTNGILYTGPITLNATTNLRAVAYAAGKTASAVLSRSYKVAATASSPRFSPPSGVYDTPQQVEITSTTSRCSIRYTTDGTDPTPTTGTLYTGPVTVSSDAEIRAIAYRSDLVPSAVSAGSYSFDTNNPGTLSLEQSAITVSETSPSLTVTVRRTGGAAGPATVQFTTIDGSALGGQDYTPVSGTLAWADGDTSEKTVLIPILNDSIYYENIEEFQLILSSPGTGAILGTPSSATIRISDDDTNMPPTLTRIAPTGSATVAAGDVLSLHFVGEDDGVSAPIEYAWDHVAGPGTATFGSPSSPITTVSFDTPGSHIVRLSAYDGEFTTMSEVEITVVPANSAPVVANPIPDQGHTAPPPYEYTFPADTFTDPDGDSLTYSASLADNSPLPAWLSFNPITRTFSGAPSSTGSYSIRVTASDGSLSANTTFTLAVNLVAGGSGPILRYTYDEGSGTTIGDSSVAGNNHSATVAGATWTSSGKYGGAYGPVGADSSIGSGGIVPSNADELNFNPRGDAFTFSTWVRVAPGTTAGYRTLIDKSVSSPNNRQIRLWTNNSWSQLQAYVGESGASLTLPGGGTLADGQWHLITLVNYNDNGTWRFRIYYNDGTAFAQGNSGNGSTVNATLRIGALSTGFNTWWGNLDDTRIYARALSREEVASLFNGPPDNPPAPHPYQGWVASSPELSARPEDQRAPASDPDGDGLPNLIEFALGGDPLAADPGLRPAAATTTESGQDYLTISFTPANTGGLSYLVEASSDLSIWSEVSDITAELSPGVPHTHRDAVPLSTSSRRFLRIRVHMVEP